VEIISTPVVVVVVVVVVTEAEIIPTRVAVVAAGEGGDYLYTCSSGSGRRSISRALLFGVCPVDN
jgi:hypothetical protein